MPFFFIPFSIFAFLFSLPPSLKIENKSERASFGTKLVHPFGSTMTVLEKSPRSFSSYAPQKLQHRGYEGKYSEY